MGNDRDYKVFRAGCYYHVYNRGNHKKPIFLDSQDFLNFLKRLKLVLGLSKSLFGSSGKGRIRLKALPESSFSVLAYCLMDNHFHFLIRQNSHIGLDRLFSRLCTSYAKYFNKKYNQVGHLFQDAFKAKLISDDRYLVYLSAYIHNNPEKPFSYEYSSLKDYLGGRAGTICEKNFILSIFKNDVSAYSKFVSNFTETDERQISTLLFEE